LRRMLRRVSWFGWKIKAYKEPLVEGLIVVINEGHGDKYSRLLEGPKRYDYSYRSVEMFAEGRGLGG